MGALGALLFCGMPLRAQVLQSTLDVGVVSLRYADSVSVTAGTLTPDFRVESERALAQLTGTYSQFKEGGWSAQGSAAGSFFTPTKRNVLGELAGIAGGSTHQDGTRTGQIVGNGRLHALGARAGVFSGGGAGATWDGAAWRRLLMGELGGWIQNAAGAALLTLTPVAVDDSIMYVDGQLTMKRTMNNLELAVLAGARAGGQNPGVDTRTRTWGSVTAVAWLIPSLAVVASGGNYPVDPTQGFPGGRFVSLGVRFGSSARRATARYPDPDGVGGAVDQPAAAALGVEGFRVDQATPGGVVLRVEAKSAAVVEVTGDFTGWAPVKLQPAGDGSWTGTFPLRAGLHQMNIRVDGGSWLVPPGLLSLKDEFGGSVGLLVIE